MLTNLARFLTLILISLLLYVGSFRSLNSLQFLARSSPEQEIYFVMYGTKLCVGSLCSLNSF